MYKQQLITSPIQPEWLWSECKLILRRVNSSNPTQQSYENLEAEVQLNSEQIQEPFQPALTFQKQLPFSPKKGFYWTKNTPLPSIFVRLQKNYLNLLHKDEQIIRIYCQLAIAYPRKKDTHFYLQEIKTTGQKRKLFSAEGQVEFDGIRLKESSIQKSNHKFSFLVTICVSSIEQNKVILKSMISTAFYTESLRTIRRKCQKKRMKIQLMSPDNFLKFLPFNSRLLDECDTEEKLIKYLKQVTENLSTINEDHPFYLIYHLFDFFQIYSNQKPDEALFQIANSFLKDRYQHKKFGRGRKIKSVKTKRINKIHEKCTITNHTFKAYSDMHRQKSVVLTFSKRITQLIPKEFSAFINRSVSINVEQPLDLQITKIEKMIKMIQSWGRFGFKIDLFRKEDLESFPKKVNREVLFQIYKQHYHEVRGVFSQF